jgi:hypothetical protein
MTQLTLTPAQDYAIRMINALDELIDNPTDTGWSDEVLMFILERPKTLRSALSAYLNKSMNDQRNRAIMRQRNIPVYKPI